MKYLAVWIMRLFIMSASARLDGDPENPIWFDRADI